jgi:hypothetical protein
MADIRGWIDDRVSAGRPGSAVRDTVTATKAGAQVS